MALLFPSSGVSLLPLKLSNLKTMPTFSNEYRISIIGAIEILLSQINVLPKLILRAEYKEKPVSGDSLQWWEFKVATEDPEIVRTYELSLHTEEVYLVDPVVGLSNFFHDLQSGEIDVDECLQDTGLEDNDEDDEETVELVIDSVRHSLILTDGK